LGIWAPGAAGYLQNTSAPPPANNAVASSDRKMRRRNIGISGGFPGAEPPVFRKQLALMRDAPRVISFTLHPFQYKANYQLICDGDGMIFGRRCLTNLSMCKSFLRQHNSPSPDLCRLDFIIEKATKISSLAFGENCGVSYF
jgi:hypothetical protein